MQRKKTGKRQFSLICVSVWMIYFCFCGGLYGGISPAQAQTGGDDMQNPVSGDRLEYTAGTVEFISDTMIKVNGTEYVYSMDISFVDMIEQPIELESIRIGDLVEVTFVPQSNEVVSVILETEKSDVPPSVELQQKEHREKRDVIIFENGVYKN